MKTASMLEARKKKTQKNRFHLSSMGNGQVNQYLFSPCQMHTIEPFKLSFIGQWPHKQHMNCIILNLANYIEFGQPIF